MVLVMNWMWRKGRDEEEEKEEEKTMGARFKSIITGFEFWLYILAIWFKLGVTCSLIYVFSVQVVVTIPLEIAYEARGAC